jgi:HlyD family secretion protein
LERTESRARSQLAQAKARLTSAESSLKTRQERLETTKEQIESCIIKAPSPGQVVYSSSMETYVRYPIEQGSQIPQGYTIIVIPDTTQLLVEIKINETWINRIEIDQKAKITTTAFPDKVFYGKVLKKAPMADSQSSSLMADVKVYTTQVRIDGTYDYLRTGMTAKVEILIDELKDVLFVPIQSVITEEESEKKVCFVMTDNGPERRPVEIGLFNDDFVEIKNGLVEGEQVLFNPPRWEAAKKEEGTQGEEDEQTGSFQEAEQMGNANGTEKEIQTESMDKTPENEGIDEILLTEIKNQIENKEKSDEVKKSVVTD